MERKEHRGGGSPGGGGGLPPTRAAAASAGAPCEGEAGSVVQRTQVLLLAGEPDGDPSVLSSFAQHVLPAAGGEPARRTAAAADTPGEPSSAHQPPPSSQLQLPSPAAPSGQLIFFLCRASSLQERAERLREVLRGVREQSRGAPAALVGVIVQPRPEEEREARGRLEDLLSEVFPAAAPEGVPVEIHTAVFSPGRPAGALQLYRVQKKRLSLQKTVSSHWLDKSMMLQILGAMLSVGTVVFGGYYFYNNPVV
ncbi:uncharacterized protein LOC128336124 [Hemicordylus capensis]|uniref:uncharacterized protein LOC128336124 n=1 Tax=Hemicordylus capensis TaxID=884348 RepID=UPI0023029BB2|nr:uncharacterized protein LOC128336124 [Hemicordylus capensis]